MTASMLRPATDGSSALAPVYPESFRSAPHGIPDSPGHPERKPSKVSRPAARTSGSASNGTFNLTDVPSDVREDLEAWIGTYVTVACEIVNGDRPATQLTRWTRPTVHQDLTRRACLVAQASGPRRRTSERWPTRIHVLSVRLSFLAPEVAEAAIHVRQGHGSRAVAARFETWRGRWVCTALEFC